MDCFPPGFGPSLPVAMGHAGGPAAVLSLTLVLGGCVSAPGYPEGWSQDYPRHDVLARSGESCDLGGSYADAGVAPEGQAGDATVSLYRLLSSPAAAPAAPGPDYVTLRGPAGGVLEVTAWRDGKPVGTGRVSHFACLENNLVSFIPGRGGGGADCVITLCAGARDIFLHRGDDGALILKTNSLVVVLPWFRWETRWYRFRPVSPLQPPR